MIVFSLTDRLSTKTDGAGWTGYRKGRSMLWGI